MIALAVGGIALSSIYAVGSASTRHFRQQQRISATQTALRVAMDQLKRDFQRAGFLATPNVQSGAEACALPGLPIDDASGSANTGRLAAVSTFAKNVTRPGGLDPANLNSWATLDTVTLMGNYSTSGEYSAISISVDGLTVTIPMGWQSFQRDFTIWSGANAGQCNSEAFNAAFPVGRLVRIHTLTDRNFFSQVAAASCVGTGPVTITLATRVPAQCNANGGWIAPVNTIRYAVQDATADEVSRIGTTNQIAVLRRGEVAPDNKGVLLTNQGTAVPIDDRTVLDYVVRFNVNFMIADLGANRTSLMPATDAAVRLAPQQVRGVIIDLAARTAEHEPEFFNAVNGLAFRLRSSTGAARVRQLHAELLLPNVAARGLL